MKDSTRVFLVLGSIFIILVLILVAVLWRFKFRKGSRSTMNDAVFEKKLKEASNNGQRAFVREGSIIYPSSREEENGTKSYLWGLLKLGDPIQGTFLPLALHLRLVLTLPSFASALKVKFGKKDRTVDTVPLQKSRYPQNKMRNRGGSAPLSSDSDDTVDGLGAAEEGLPRETATPRGAGGGSRPYDVPYDSDMASDSSEGYPGPTREKLTPSRR
ncbi:hypothetical protein T439DRAFT_332987 [Meredithblackwellia eburnea MCA 4105]